MAVYQKLDKDLVDLTHENIQEIASFREEVQHKADKAHKQFLKECQILGTEFDEDERCGS